MIQPESRPESSEKSVEETEDQRDARKPSTLKDLEIILKEEQSKITLETGKHFIRNYKNYMMV